MLLIPLLGPWLAMPVLVTGAVLFFVGTVLNFPTVTPVGTDVLAIANLIIILGLA